MRPRPLTASVRAATTAATSVSVSRRGAGRTDQVRHAIGARTRRAHRADRPIRPPILRVRVCRRVNCSTVEGAAMTTAGSGTPPTDMTITEHELQQCEEANATGRPPVVFVHGLWLLPSSWDRWAALFEEDGYVALTPGWPDDPETVEEAKAHPEGVRRRVDRPGGRSLRGDHPRAHQEAGHRRPFLRRAADPDPCRAWPGCCLGGDRPGTVPRRTPAAHLVAEVGLPCAGQPGQPQPRGPADLRAVPLRLRQRRQRGRGQAAVRDLCRAHLREAAVPGGGSQPQPRGPRPRSTPTTHSAAHC